jgi:hypothetical protein
MISSVGILCMSAEKQTVTLKGASGSLNQDPVKINQQRQPTGEGHLFSSQVDASYVHA